jgi:ATP adenylyltransferase
MPARSGSILASERQQKKMDTLWTPWRYAYITGTDKTARTGVPAALAAWNGDKGCVFCNLIAAVDYAIAQGTPRDEAEAAGHIVHRGKDCFICLNAFPYTSGHVMVMPYAHLDRLAALPTATAHELMDLAQRTEQVLEQVYKPHGLNFGLNLGEAAGAGVAGHLHLHAMPRWTGDTNFMTTVSETRVIPEDLETTWKRLRKGFAAEPA